MKIIYCINSIHNSGGMEKILMLKANYLADVLNYDISIVTTEQRGQSHFFPFSKNIIFFDLGINYDEDRDKNLFYRYILKQRKKRIHKQKLTSLLKKEKADICISMFDREFDFLYKINDGSKKILEYHFSKYIKVIEARNPIIKWIQKNRTNRWTSLVQKYHRFIVLTEEDKSQWGNLNNILVIPNFIPYINSEKSTNNSTRVISVGRACFQKGFDLLIDSWEIVSRKFPEWELYIFGNGDKRNLEEKIQEKNIHTIKLMPATSEIDQEYLNSSIYVMSSRYEGLPLVLIEAMSFGLPLVSFACPCGPKDIIKENYGSLVPNGNVEALAKELMKWMADYNKRKKGGYYAHEAAKQYSQEVVMKKWIELFDKVINE